MAAGLKVLNSTLWGEQHLVFTGTTVVVGTVVGIYFPSCWILFHFLQHCIEHCIKRFSSFFNLRRMEGAWATHDLESAHISATTLASPTNSSHPFSLCPEKREIPSNGCAHTAVRAWMGSGNTSPNCFWMSLKQVWTHQFSSSPLPGWKERQLPALLPFLHLHHWKWFPRNQNEMMLLKNKNPHLS